MPYNKQLLKNVNTIAQFEHLESFGKNPKLVVYRGKSLLIISKDSDTILSKISQRIKQFLLKIFGLIKEDGVQIQNLKDEVYAYHYAQAAKHKEPEIKAFEAHANALQEKTSALEGKLSQLTSSEEKLNAAISSLAANRAAIDEEYCAAKSVLDQKEQTKLLLSQLEQNAKSLEAKIQVLKQEEGQLSSMHTKLNEAKSKLTAVQQDISQQDYKTQLDGLKNQMGHQRIQMQQKIDTANSRAAFWMLSHH